jgi:hypothetical protein
MEATVTDFVKEYLAEQENVSPDEIYEYRFEAEESSNCPTCGDGFSTTIHYNVTGKRKSLWMGEYDTAQFLNKYARSLHLREEES